jgi:hypothetical protein
MSLRMFLIVSLQKFLRSVFTIFLRTIIRAFCGRLIIGAFYGRLIAVFSGIHTIFLHVKKHRLYIKNTRIRVYA